MAEFTYLWTNRCRLNMIEAGCEGEPTDIAAGNVFTKRGIRKGDAVYIVTVNGGNVYLVGRMKVKRIWDREDWEAGPGRDNPNLWDGDEVIEGEDGTPLRFESTIPATVLKALRFTDGGGREKGLAMEGSKLADPQSIRSVRRLTYESARELDKLLS